MSGPDTRLRLRMIVGWFARPLRPLRHGAARRAQLDALVAAAHHDLQHPNNTPAVAALHAQIETLHALIREREAVVAAREAVVREREAVIQLQQQTIDQQPDQQPDQRPDQDGRLDPSGLDAPGLQAAIETIHRTVPGWCTLEKAQALAALVQDSGARNICEVGVYGGRSLLPMALAAARHPGAAVYAVEPWSNEIATATATDEGNDQWWRDVDLQKAKSAFVSHVLSFGLVGTVKIVELSSNAARAAFQQNGVGPFDLLHIDGSHSETQALADVQTWLRLVAPRGIIVLDDIGWHSVAKARAYLQSHCHVIEEIFDQATDSSYGIYRTMPVAPRLQEHAAGVLDFALPN